MAPRISAGRGFSAMELLVVTAVIAVLASFAVPTYVRLSRQASLSAAANQMLWALHLARSTSILRGEAVAVCLSGEGAGCLGSAAQQAAGWLVFVDRETSTPVRVDPGDQVLRQLPLPPGVVVRGTRAAVTFWPVAMAGTTGTFTFCAGADGRAVVISQTGRPRVKTKGVSCAA
jgi:type IV fimbrial biogenesis protein FimT